MAYVHKVPPGESLEFVNEASPGSSQDDTVLESGGESKQDQFVQKSFTGETGGGEAVISDAPQSGGGAPEMPVKEDSKPKEEGGQPETLVGKGLESIGDLVVDTLQPVATVVGRVAQAPTVIMANLVGGFDSKPEEKDVAVQEGLQNVSSPSSPQTPQGGDKLNVYSPTSSRWTRLLTPRGTPILNRIEHLELQMSMLEEKYNPKTISTEHNLSPNSQLVTPRTRERLRTARSLLRETESKGTLVERVSFLEARLTEHMESIERTLSCIDSKLAGVDSKLKHEQLELPASIQENHGDKRDTALASFDPSHLASTQQGSKEALVKDSSVAVPSGTSLEPIHKEDIPSSLESSELGLPSTLKEPREAVAKGSSAAVPRPESVQEDDAEKSGAANVSAVSQSTSRVEEPQNAPGGSVKEAKSSSLPTQNEAEYKLAEDVEATAKAPEIRPSDVVEPKPFGTKEKSSKKEKIHDGSKIVEGQSRDNSLVRAMEKDRHPFKHLRDRFRRAFRTKNDS
ncbi:uncharacterized protein [Physcomitrium patens]|uniref:Uncharacterized protein n=2 Tax=Physcomitrium patens TaxID=3218 RepID=A0A7I4A232_PHYPA|nr:uncharacterized protein LOC112287736 isoform X2 [Physcomitrium patens]XP_024386842.1 uncharacterized protein LOC112287736 isoform X2 [Physcomitrium patens]XP_024386843.1 uncharacterized protein LOC112287736 isoform X2 [Physcomitrium patens]|eukprot:XP_024386841.1 uncharacterized protein LOC112287736 isoform X2 [Physcomitrella patens]